MLVVANVAIGRLASSSVPRQKIRAITLAAGATDIFLGNSLMDAAVDSASFAGAAPSRTVLNLGLGSTSAVEHYLLLLAAGRLHPKAVYYGFFDTQLTDSAEGSFGVLFGNRAMAYYVYPDTAMRFYASHKPLLQMELRVFRFLPMVVNRSAYWGKVETWRRTLHGLGMPQELSDRFGRVSDFSLLEADPREFKVRLRSAVDQRLSLSSPVSALLRLKNKVGVAVLCVVMPMPSSHRLRYYDSSEWHAYLSYISETLRHDNVGLIDASAWIPDDGFADPLHLNSGGANRFSSSLAKALFYDSAMVAKPESIR